MSGIAALEKQESKRKIRKAGLKEKLEKYLADYKNVLLCRVDNIGSHQMQKVRIALRGRAELLMGKNTLMRKVIREQAAVNKNLEALAPLVKGNLGLVFTNDSLTEIREIIEKNKVPAAARTNTFAPVDVFIPPGATGLDPGQTSFFQALNIATKITRGAIEILNQVHLIKKGEKVSASHVALLTKLDIKPFFYNMTVKSVYENGSVYDAAVLDMTQEDLLAKFFNGVRKLAALSLSLGYPTAASLPVLMGSGFRKILAISLATAYEIKEAKEVMAAAAAAGPVAAAPAAGGSSGAAAAAAPAKEEEPEEEEEADLGLSLFD